MQDTTTTMTTIFDWKKKYQNSKPQLAIVYIRIV